MAIVPSKQLESTLTCYSSKIMPVMVSDWSCASKTHSVVLKSHALIIPSSSPLISRVSFAKWTRLIGEGCAFFIICETSPEASINANLLSYPHVASTELLSNFTISRRIESTMSATRTMGTCYRSERDHIL